MQLWPGAPESLLIRLFTALWIPLPLGTAGQELCLRSWPGLTRGGCGRQVQAAAVVQRAPESYLVSVCRLLTFEEGERSR